MLPNNIQYSEDLALVNRVKNGDHSAIDTIYEKLNWIIMSKAFFICKKTCGSISQAAKYCPDKKNLSSCEDFNDARAHVFKFLLNMEKQTGPLLNYRAIASLKTYVMMVLEKYSPYLINNWYRKKKKRYIYGSHYPAVIKQLSQVHKEAYVWMLKGKGTEYIAHQLYSSNHLTDEEALDNTQALLNDIKHLLYISGHNGKISRQEVQINESLASSNHDDPEQRLLQKRYQEKLLDKFAAIHDAFEQLTTMEKLIIRLMANNDWSGKKIALHLNTSSLKKNFPPPGTERINTNVVYRILTKALKRMILQIQESAPDFFIPEWTEGPIPDNEKEKLKYVKVFINHFGVQSG